MTSKLPYTEVKLLPNSQVNPVLEMFIHDARNTNPDITDFWNNDTKGWGLIVSLERGGGRVLVELEASETPFAHMDEKLHSSDFIGALIIRVRNGFFLDETEVKALSGLMQTRLRNNSNVHFFGPKWGAPLRKETREIFNRIIDDSVVFLNGFGFDVVAEPDVSQQPAVALEEGSEEVTVNGVKVIVTTRLKDKNNPEAGYGYISVEVSDEEGNNLLTASTGA
jgi:hypothetical protein